MMSGMLKQNVQSVFNIMMFSGIGNIFSGFVICKFPFPLGTNFKQMTQQGVRLLNLDPSWVSSMSWSFLLIYGLSGILQLLITDRAALAESMMAQAGTQMMNQGGMMGQSKDYNPILKAEKENYEILNWKFELDDVEDAFVVKYKGRMPAQAS
tara:strand:+ start:500 stop:958 length:459 start_codon:yes stop_codon:yes gene_type:complete